MIWGYLISGMPSRLMLRNYDRSFKAWMHWKRRLSCFDDRELRQSKQNWTQNRGKVPAACGAGSLEPRLINLNRDRFSSYRPWLYILLVTFIYPLIFFTDFILVSGIRVHFDHRRIRKSLVSPSGLVYCNHSNVPVGFNIVHINASCMVILLTLRFNIDYSFHSAVRTGCFIFLRPYSLVSM